MKKANRILMATVAVLLSLVLITTSVVSGIFARFTVLQEAKTQMTLNKFGVSLGLTLSDEFVALLGGQDAVDDMTTVNGDSISINITNLKMAPGDQFLDAMKFTFSGVANVRFKALIEVNMPYEGAIAEYSKGLPIGLVMTCLDSNGESRTESLISSWDDDVAQEQSSYASKDMSQMLGVATRGFKDHGCVEKVFEIDDAFLFHPGSLDESGNLTSTFENIDINNVAFGLYWLMNGHDEHDTWAANNAANISQELYVSIKIEQVTSTYTAGTNG